MQLVVDWPPGDRGWHRGRFLCNMRAEFLNTASPEFLRPTVSNRRPSMKVLVVPQVLHGGSLYSIDINADGEVLTSGNDRYVRVWPTQLWAADPTTTIETQPVATHGYHEACVSIARWNPQNTKVFVSGDLRGDVFLNDTAKNEVTQVYPLASMPPTAVSDPDAGVVDLSWSPDGRLFAWSTQNRQLYLCDTKHATLQSFSLLLPNGAPAVLRSIAFDPTGNYLICLGDDSLIHLYQYQYDGEGGYRFRQIQKISKLVNNMAFNYNSKRTAWSPDGEYVCVPTANKNLTSLVSLISRSKNWTNIISLVGHDLNCEVAKFNPHLFQADTAPGSFAPYCVTATAGSDKTLVVWNTTNESPISILKDISSGPITDLCWNKAGDHLLAASVDGHITIIRFENDELGKVADAKIVKEVKELGRATIKSFDFKYETETPIRRGQTNIQDVILESKNATSLTETKSDRMNGEFDAVSNAAKPSQNASSAPKPLLITTPEVILAPPLDDLTSFQTTDDDILQTAMGRSKKPPATKSAKEPAAQKVTTKNGKKRIQPMLISHNGSVNGSESHTPIATANPVALSEHAPQQMEFDKVSYAVTNDVYKQSKRLRQSEASSTKKPKRALEPVKFLETVVVNPNTAFAEVRLGVPKVRLAFQLKSHCDSELFVLDIKNGSGNESKPSRITYYKKDKEIWSDFVPRFIQLGTEGTSFWAVATMDGQILTYSRISGRRLTPPIVLGSSLSFLESHGDFLMAVTSIGELYVWNVALKKMHLQAPSTLSNVLELSNKYREDGLSRSEGITMCSVTSSGIPLVTMSNGTGYLYNRDLCAWQVISESWWAFGSHYWDSVGEQLATTLSATADQHKVSVIALLEQKTNDEVLRKTRLGRGKYFNKISKNMIMKEGFESIENAISLSHLENRIACCELLGEQQDFETFFIAYAKRVCELSLKTKVYEICDQLLGPPPGSDLPWDPKVCGIDKHKLLQRVIDTCSHHRDLQRILIHFAKQLGVIKSGINEDLFDTV